MAKRPSSRQSVDDRGRRLRDPGDLLPLPPQDLQVLILLAEGPLHAYGISKAAEEGPEASVRLEIGSLYRMLARMLTAGLIEEVAADDSRRRTYRITGFGRAVAEAETRRLADVLEQARRHFVPDPHAG